MRKALMVVAMLGWTGMAQAQPPAPDCPAPPKIWQGARPLAAARTLGGDPHPVLMLGTPADVALVPAATMILVAPLGKPIAPGDRGGLLTFHIGLTGTYRIALGGKAWIDVVQQGKALPSTGHAHGAPCSGEAKRVDFALVPGDYILQITEAAAPHVGVSLTRLP